MCPQYDGLFAGVTPGAGFAPMQIETPNANGALVAFATSPGQVAFDGANGHSPFTMALLAHLADANAPLTTVMTHVTGDVFAATNGKRRPWVNASLTEELSLNRIAAPEPKPVAGATPAAPNDQVAMHQMRRLIPTIEDDRPIHFDTPVKFGDPAVDGKSIAELITGQPLYSPVESLDKAVWDHPCAACHNWTKERLHTQSNRYDRVDISVPRLQHPYGSRFKVALAKWAKEGCK